MEVVAVLVISILGLSSVSSQAATANPDSHCHVSRVSHFCTLASGPLIMNICYPYFNVRDLNSCIRRAPQDDRMTCYPCCQDPLTSIQHCARIRNRSEDARWTFDLAAVPEINPCDAEYLEQQCVQPHYKTTGLELQTLPSIQNWQECQTKCREMMGCEWFDYISLRRKCILKKQGTSRRNTRRVTGFKRQENYYSGSIMSSDTSSANCHCPNNNRYGTSTTTERSDAWGRGSSFDNNQYRTRTTTERSNAWGRGSSGNNNQYGTPTTTERSSAWGWGSWGNPCPTGNKQTQHIMGVGIIQCCPLEEGTDGTQICQY